MALKWALGTLAAWNALSASEQAEYENRYDNYATWTSGDGYDLDVVDDTIFELISDVDGDASDEHSSHHPDWNGYDVTFRSRGSSRYKYLLRETELYINPRSYDNQYVFGALTIDRVDFYGISTEAWTTVYIHSGSGAINIADCSMNDTGDGSSGMALFFIGGKPTEINFERCFMNANDYAECIEISPDGGVAGSLAVTISACSFVNSDYWGVSIWGADDELDTVRIEHCTFHNITGEAMTIFNRTNPFTLELDSLVVTFDDGFGPPSGSLDYYEAGDLTSSSFGKSCYDSPVVTSPENAFGASMPNMTWTDTGNDIDPATAFISTTFGNYDYLKPVASLSNIIAIGGLVPQLSSTDINGDAFASLYSVGSIQKDAIVIADQPKATLLMPVGEAKAYILGNKVIDDAGTTSVVTTDFLGARDASNNKLYQDGVES